jgi:HEAT repeat protein
MPKITTQRLSDKPSIERWNYITDLGRRGKAAMDLLLSYLKDEDKWVRCLVIDALGNIRDPRVVSPLITALGDRDQDVRVMAAEALGKVGDARAVEALQKTWEVDNPCVQIAAETAIARLRFGARPQ